MRVIERGTDEIKDRLYNHFLCSNTITLALEIESS